MSRLLRETMSTRLSELKLWHLVGLIVFWEVIDAVSWLLCCYGDRVLRAVGL